ncbi:EAL domain-containing protein [Lusitaniella coriacea]|uniref:EAL domain-containing protein n=1 Tax=Lusitaniella coriacea TaxID=1983105 RepID=UPI003CF79044
MSKPIASTVISMAWGGVAGLSCFLGLGCFLLFWLKLGQARQLLEQFNEQLEHLFQQYWFQLTILNRQLQEEVSLRQHLEQQLQQQKESISPQQSLPKCQDFEPELTIQLRQQSAVAQLGQWGLEGVDLSTLMDRAVALVSRVLEVKSCLILEVLPDDSALWLKAGVGWQAGCVRQATLGVGTHSWADYTLRSQASVLFEDARLETRFTIPPLLRDRHLTSGLSCAIPGKNKSFGILGVFSARYRVFGDRERNFLQAIASVLATAVARQQAEDELQLMKRAIEASSNGIIISDAIASKMPVVYVNSRFEQLTGYGKKDILGRNCRFLQGEETDQLSLEKLRKALSEGRECYTVLRNYRKDGSLFWNELHVAPVRNAQGHLTHFIGIQNDITKRKQLEETLRLVVEQTSSVTGTAFFRAIVSTLSSLLHVRYVGIAEPTTPNYERVRTIAFWDGEKFNEGFEFAMVGTPCETISGKRPILYSENVQAIFPEDDYLKEHNIESYWGIALFDTAGQRSGHLFLMDDKPLVPTEWSESLLQILIDRVSAELDRVRVENALRDEEARLRTILSATSDALLVVDTQGYVHFANPAAASLFGRSIEVLTGYWFGSIFVIGDMAEIEILQPTGKLILAEMRVEETLWDRQSAYLATLRDVTERRDAEAKLRESEEKYRHIVQTASEGILTTNADDKIAFANQQIAQMLGYQSDEMVGKTLLDFVDKTDRAMVETHLNRCQGEREEQYDFRLRCKDGSDLWVIISARPFFDSEGNYAGTLKMLTDITERKRVEAQLHHHAFYDPLTDLPNRSLFINRLKRTIRRSKRHGGYPFAVLFMDLDDFKVINNSLGHMVGDRFLIAIARRLEACLNSSDILARLGGDEFTILLEEVRDVGDAIALAKKIHKILQDPFEVDSREIFTNASIGIALSNSEYHYPEDFLRDADAAMYKAKALGKAQYAVFDREMHEKILGRLHLETDLRRAIERQELLVFYQPIVCLKTSNLLGFEALVRWQHPERGLISPTEFIAIAEETGLIISLDRWVLREACSQRVRWQSQFPHLPPLTISANLSSQQFKHPNLARQIQEILRQTRLDGRYLKLEITESLLMDSTQSAIQMLHQLRAMKIQLSIDDFGTGYSSFSYLHRLPVNTLKIDRSFIQQMNGHDSKSEIVKAIINLAHTLDMDTIAEGIETVAQFRQLEAMNCEYGQGYFFAKPLSSQGATALITQSIPQERDRAS